MKSNRQPILYLFASLFLISGAAGLIYEIVWERLLELYFGVTMVSVTLIVSAYMAGLGLGSLIGGRIARDLKNTLFSMGFWRLGSHYLDSSAQTSLSGLERQPRALLMFWSS